MKYLSMTLLVRSWIRLFLWSSGLLLILTGVAKMISAGGKVPVLNLEDPILKISFKHLFASVGALEVFIGAVCFSRLHVSIKAGLLAWVSTMFVCYRLGLFLIGFHAPCKCLGTLSSALHITPEIVDAVMKVILAYISTGSYLTTVKCWRESREMQNVPRSSGTALGT